MSLESAGFQLTIAGAPQVQQALQGLVTQLQNFVQVTTQVGTQTANAFKGLDAAGASITRLDALSTAFANNTTASFNALQNTVRQIGPTLAEPTTRFQQLRATMQQVGPAILQNATSFGVFTASIFGVVNAIDTLTQREIQLERARVQANQSQVTLAAAEDTLNRLRASSTATADQIAVAEDRVATARQRVTLENQQTLYMENELNQARAQFAAQIFPQLIATVASGVQIYAQLNLALASHGGIIGALRPLYTIMTAQLGALGLTLGGVSGGFQVYSSSAIASAAATNQVSTSIRILEIALGPIGWTILAITAAMTAFITNFLGFRDWVNGVGEALGNMFPFLEGFLEILGQFGEGIVNFFGMGEGGLGDATEGIQEFAEATKLNTDEVILRFKELEAGVTVTFDSIAQGIDTGVEAIERRLATLPATLATAIQDITNLFQPGAEEGKFKPFIGDFEAATDWLTENITGPAGKFLTDLFGVGATDETNKLTIPTPIVLDENALAKLQELTDFYNFLQTNGIPIAAELDAIMTMVNKDLAETGTISKETSQAVVDLFTNEEFRKNQLADIYKQQLEFVLVDKEYIDQNTQKVAQLRELAIQLGLTSEQVANLTGQQVLNRQASEEQLAIAQQMVLGLEDWSVLLQKSAEGSADFISATIAGKTSVFEMANNFNLAATEAEAFNQTLLSNLDALDQSLAAKDFAKLLVDSFAGSIDEINNLFSQLEFNAHERVQNLDEVFGDLPKGLEKKLKEITERFAEQQETLEKEVSAKLAGLKIIVNQPDFELDETTVSEITELVQEMKDDIAEEFSDPTTGKLTPMGVSLTNLVGKIDPTGTEEEVKTAVNEATDAINQAKELKGIILTLDSLAIPEPVKETLKQQIQEILNPDSTKGATQGTVLGAAETKPGISQYAILGQDITGLTTALETLQNQDVTIPAPETAAFVSAISEALGLVNSLSVALGGEETGQAALSQQIEAAGGPAAGGGGIQTPVTLPAPDTSAFVTGIMEAVLAVALLLIYIGEPVSTAGAGAEGDTTGGGIGGGNTLMTPVTLPTPDVTSFVSEIGLAVDKVNALVVALYGEGASTTTEAGAGGAGAGGEGIQTPVTLPTPDVESFITEIQRASGAVYSLLNAIGGESPEQGQLSQMIEEAGGPPAAEGGGLHQTVVLPTPDVESFIAEIQRAFNAVNGLLFALTGEGVRVEGGGGEGGGEGTVEGNTGGNTLMTPVTLPTPEVEAFIAGIQRAFNACNGLLYALTGEGVQYEGSDEGEGAVEVETGGNTLMTPVTLPTPDVEAFVGEMNRALAVVSALALAIGGESSEQRELSEMIEAAGGPAAGGPSLLTPVTLPAADVEAFVESIQEAIDIVDTLLNALTGESVQGAEGTRGGGGGDGGGVLSEVVIPAPDFTEFANAFDVAGQLLETFVELVNTAPLTIPEPVIKPFQDGINQATAIMDTFIVTVNLAPLKLPAPNLSAFESSINQALDLLQDVIDMLDSIDGRTVKAVVEIERQITGSSSGDQWGGAEIIDKDTFVRAGEGNRPELHLFFPLDKQAVAHTAPEFRLPNIDKSREPISMPNLNNYSLPAATTSNVIPSPSPTININPIIPVNIHIDLSEDIRKLIRIPNAGGPRVGEILTV